MRSLVHTGLVRMRESMAVRGVHVKVTGRPFDSKFAQALESDS